MYNAERKGHTQKTLKLPVLWNSNKTVIMFRTQKDAERWIEAEDTPWQDPVMVANGLWEIKRRQDAISLDYK